MVENLGPEQIAALDAAVTAATAITATTGAALAKQATSPPAPVAAQCAGSDGVDDVVPARISMSWPTVTLILGLTLGLPLVLAGSLIGLSMTHTVPMPAAAVGVCVGFVALAAITALVFFLPVSKGLAVMMRIFTAATDAIGKMRAKVGKAIRKGRKLAANAFDPDSDGGSRT